MKQKITGFLLIDKPAGPTSHDIVNRLRRITKIKTIGHAGTLDPLATGLLILGIGRKATKKLSFFLKQNKEYLAQIKLGAVSQTDDGQGPIRQTRTEIPPLPREIKSALKNLRGQIKQVPPAFSAKKIKGQKLYKLARKGIEPKPRAVKVEIFELKLFKYNWPFLELKIKCSSGTYIRSLARDLGQALGCGAYLFKLRRTKIGRYSLKKASPLTKINTSNWQKLLFQTKIARNEVWPRSGEDTSFVIR